MVEKLRDPDCIFCKILEGVIPAAVIFEDDDVMAFMDAFPASQGHALIIPRGHYANIHETPESVVVTAARAAKRLAAAQKQALAPDGITVSQFNGAAAGQTVYHYHVHLIPRWEGQGGLRPSHGRDQGDPALLRELAERIRGAL
ncbi:MAG: HIT domain-containing protein [Aquisalimonadaceae bacterium]